MKLFTFFIFIFLISQTVFAAPKEIKIGVLAKRGSNRALEKWKPIAKFLTKELAPIKFKIVSLSFQEIDPAIENKNIDFVIMNPALYITHEMKNSIFHIATLINFHHAYQDSHQFGGVIFTKKENTKINNLKDIVGKSFGAVDKNSFGGWYMAYYEFITHHINPYQDFKGVDFFSTHDNVVSAVLSGKVDVGTVRTGLLEHLTEEGSDILKKIKIINEKKLDNFSLIHSTEIYPEWPLAKLSHISPELSKAVAIKLIQMESNHPALHKAHIKGWSLPMDYRKVHNCLGKLNVGPYINHDIKILNEFISRYKIFNWVFSILFITILSFLVLTLFFVKKLKHREKDIISLNSSLEEKVKEKTEELTTINSQLEQRVQDELAKRSENEQLLVSQNKMAQMGEMIGMIAHQWKQPLNIIGLSMDLLKDCSDEIKDQETDEINTIEKNIRNQVELMNSSINLFKDFYSPNSDVLDFQCCTPIKNSKKLIMPKLEKNSIKMVIHHHEHFNLQGPTTDFQEVLLNLLNNSIDAINDEKRENGLIECFLSLENNNGVIKIRDNGGGIPEDLLPQIFNKFKTTKGSKGTGLGLFIAKIIIKKKFGGDIIVRNSGNGAEFVITIPLPKQS